MPQLSEQTKAATPTAPAIMSQLQESPGQVVLAAYIDREWRESTYSTNDPSWKESLKILQAASIPVKLFYSTSAQP